MFERILRTDWIQKTGCQMSWTKIRHKKFCVGCKRWFWPNSGVQKYCTPECKSVVDYCKDSEYQKRYRQAHGKYKGIAEKKRFCPICKRWFTPKNYRHIVCSKECKEVWSAMLRTAGSDSTENRPENWYPHDPLIGANISCMTQDAPRGLICPAL